MLINLSSCPIFCLHFCLRTFLPPNIVALLKVKKKYLSLLPLQQKFYGVYTWNKILMRESWVQQVNSALSTESHRIRMIFFFFFTVKNVKSIPRNSGLGFLVWFGFFFSSKALSSSAVLFHCLAKCLHCQRCWPKAGMWLLMLICQCNVEHRTWRQRSWNGLYGCK